MTAGLVVAGTISWGRFVLAFAIAAGTAVLITLAPRLRGGASERAAARSKATARDR
jgi:hypothetical protein